MSLQEEQSFNQNKADMTSITKLFFFVACCQIAKYRPMVIKLTLPVDFLTVDYVSGDSKLSLSHGRKSSELIEKGSVLHNDS